MHCNFSTFFFSFKTWKRFQNCQYIWCLFQYSDVIFYGESHYILLSTVCSNTNHTVWSDKIMAEINTPGLRSFLQFLKKTRVKEWGMGIICLPCRWLGKIEHFKRFKNILLKSIPHLHQELNQVSWLSCISFIMMKLFRRTGPIF